MGLIVDSGVFIRVERVGDAIDLSPWARSDGVFISAITVSELLMGVLRADTDERRQRRGRFVEEVLAGVPVLDFTSAVARRHAEVHAALLRSGQAVGAHDLIIAATALHHGLSVLTDNIREFSRVPGLHAIAFSA